MLWQLQEAQLVTATLSLKHEMVERTICAQHLARHDLLIEEGLALLDVGGKALGLGLVDLGLDSLPLPQGRRLGFLLLGAGLSAFVSSDVATEVGLAASLVVEVYDVTYP